MRNAEIPVKENNDSTLAQFRASVEDGAPKLSIHSVNILCLVGYSVNEVCGGPRVVVSTAAFHVEFGARFPVSAV